MKTLYCIGLTGGIASGKSSVVSILKELDYPVIEADLLAREVVKRGEGAYWKLKAAFPCCFNREGELDRRSLAHFIHQHEGARKEVNRITHPEILLRMEAAVEGYRKEGALLVFVDVPLLFEVGIEDRFHEVWVVYVEEKEQLRRLMARDALSREEARQYISSQIPLARKASWAHRLIHNTGTKEDLKREVLCCLSAFLRQRGGL